MKPRTEWVRNLGGCRCESLHRPHVKNFTRLSAGARDAPTILSHTAICSRRNPPNGSYALSSHYPDQYVTPRMVVGNSGWQSSVRFWPRLCENAKNDASRKLPRLLEAPGSTISTRGRVRRPPKFVEN